MQWKWNFPALYRSDITGLTFYKNSQNNLSSNKWSVWLFAQLLK